MVTRYAVEHGVMVAIPCLKAMNLCLIGRNGAVSDTENGRHCKEFFLKNPHKNARITT